MSQFYPSLQLDSVDVPHKLCILYAWSMRHALQVMHIRPEECGGGLENIAKQGRSF